jgi:hypothetical protein
MTGLPAWFVAIGMAASTAVPTPATPVPLVPGDYGPCSTASIANLAAGDFVSVRSGPSRRARELHRLRNGREVYACVRQGNWFGIVFEDVPRQTGCGVFERPRRTEAVYRGPCRSGWVHERYLMGYADWVSP